MSASKEMHLRVADDLIRHVLIIGTSRERLARTMLPPDVTGWASVLEARFMRIDGRWVQHGFDDPNIPLEPGVVPGVLYEKPIRKSTIT